MSAFEGTPLPDVINGSPTTSLLYPLHLLAPRMDDVAWCAHAHHRRHSIFFFPSVAPQNGNFIVGQMEVALNGWRGQEERKRGTMCGASVYGVCSKCPEKVARTHFYLERYSLQLLSRNFVQNIYRHEIKGKG